MKIENKSRLTFGIYATPRTTSSRASGLDSSSSGQAGNNSVQTCIICLPEHTCQRHHHYIGCILFQNL